jgi:hypothetical protein
MITDLLLEPWVAQSEAGYEDILEIVVTVGIEVYGCRCTAQRKHLTRTKSAERLRNLLRRRRKKLILTSESRELERGIFLYTYWTLERLFFNTMKRGCCIEKQLIPQLTLDTSYDWFASPNCRTIT